MTAVCFKELSETNLESINQALRYRSKGLAPILYTFQRNALIAKVVEDQASNHFNGFR